MPATFGWNFARRPFRDERPVLLAIAVMAVLALVFLAANWQLYRRFSRQVEGTRREISELEKRRDLAAHASEESRRAVEGYRLSALAEEAAGLQTIVQERRFSWLALLARLERTLPPDVRLSRLLPRFDSSESVRLDLAVLGKSPDSVVRTIAALSKDPAFHDVELQAEATPEKGVPEGYTFTMNVRYVPQEAR
jgi:Tfp pilus assembly protein PilN